MGYLSTSGKTKDYKSSLQTIPYIKQHGLIQFLNVFLKHKDVKKQMQDLKWGDEGEYHLIHFDKKNRAARVIINSKEIIEAYTNFKKDSDIVLQPEFGSWMVEAVPRDPFDGLTPEVLGTVEQSIKNRRLALKEFLKPYKMSINSMSSFPALGTKNHYTSFEKLDKEARGIPVPPEKRLEDLAAENVYSKSLFVSDSEINPHPRFGALVRNIRESRGSKVEIKIPIYQDKHTSNIPTPEEPFPGSIYMDSMHFGMGSCCLQCTFETTTINHTRYLHDQFIAFTPIMAAISANAPIFKGKLADIDMRWTVISQSVDNRTEEQRDPSSDEFVPKSRYSTMNHYISNHEYVDEESNDAQKYKVNPGYMKMLMDKGVDEKLAYHISHLFVRDPMTVYDNSTEIDDSSSTAHFENLQSTNWNSLRFKPPPSVDSKIGWRVEFRTMDIQLNDFENAALNVFVGMLVNIINHFDVNFIMPITKVDENMDRAHNRDAILKDKFWFRTNVLGNKDNYQKNELIEHDFLKCNSLESREKGVFSEMSILDILLGKSELGYHGIIPLMEEYMDIKQYTPEQKHKISTYLNFIVKRSQGEIPTGARFIRDFVMSHPAYKQDSIVSQEICYDLVRLCTKIGYSMDWEEQFFQEDSDN